MKDSLSKQELDPNYVRTSSMKQMTPPAFRDVSIHIRLLWKGAEPRLRYHELKL